MSTCLVFFYQPGALISIPIQTLFHSPVSLFNVLAAYVYEGEWRFGL
jgi:hypothetical protein